MQKKRIALAFSAVLLSSLVGAASVNGVAIPENRVEFLAKQVIARGQAPDTPELRTRIREDLIRNEVVVQEAIKQGLDKNTEVTNQFELAKSQILFGAFINEYVKNNPVPEAAQKQFYEQQVKPQFSGKEYRTRHILVAKEAEAKAILGELKKGKKFDALAKAKSIDTGSGANGGDLGWTAPAGLVKEFAEAMVKLPKGKISDAPVKTQFGFHIIKVEDVRDLKAPAFDEVKGDIQQELQNQALQKLMTDLRAKAKIE